MNSSPLRIALIVDGVRVSKYDADLIEWMMTQDHLEASHLIIQKLSTQQVQGRWSKAVNALKQSGWSALAQLVLWNVIARIELLRLRRYAGFADHLSPADVSKKVPNHLYVTPIQSKSGLVHRFSSDDIDAIRKEAFDVILRCGSGILKGDILHSARFGILSFHHADNCTNRGGPAGFWEVYYGKPKTGYIIQRLTEELDGGDVLDRGYYSTQGYALLNNAYIQTKSLKAMKRILLNLAHTGSLPAPEEKWPYDNRLFKYPGVQECMTYLLKQSLHLCSRHLKKYLNIHDRWYVAYQHCTWRESSMWRGKTLPNPDGCFLADPFVLQRDGRTYVFVENYHYATNKGRIAVYDLSSENPDFLGIALEEPFHLSFPYVFEYAGNLYMCPESVANQDIRIYRCIEFPLRWELAKQAMKSVAAVDSMIFEHHGLWWLFTNISDSEPHDFCELHLFWASDPLSDTWHPHPLNPVVADPELARNGGVLRDGQKLFRVAQSQGRDEYGVSALLRHIEILTQEDYKETTQTALEPHFAREASGIHHMHAVETVTVWDYKKQERI